MPYNLYRSARWRNTIHLAAVSFAGLSAGATCWVVASSKPCPDPIQRGADSCQYVSGVQVFLGNAPPGASGKDNRTWQNQCHYQCLRPDGSIYFWSGYPGYVLSGANCTGSGATP